MPCAIVAQAVDANLAFSNAYEILLGLTEAERATIFSVPQIRS